MSAEGLPHTLPHTGNVPGENPAEDLDPGTLVHDLTYYPDLALQFADDPHMQQFPDLYAGVWAAVQRSYLLGDIRLKDLLSRRAQTEQILVSSDEWRKTLHRVGSGYAPAHELQLVLWSAQPRHRELHVHRHAGLYKAAGKVGLTRIPPLDLWEGDKNHDAWAALQSFALVNPKYGQHFNPPAGHLLAIGQTELMHETGLLTNMDVRWPHPLISVMLDQLREFIGLAKSSGEYNTLPQEVWWTAKAVEQYEQDVATYRQGNTSVFRAQGRLWQFLSDPDGYKRYRNYLEMRASESEHTDQRYHECFRLTPQGLDAWIGHFLKLASQPPPAGTDRTAHYVHTSEMVGAAWAAVTLRQHERGVQPVIARHHRAVQQLLEPYVLDGLPIVAKRKESQWLSLIVLNGWYDHEDRVSVFTPAYGSEAEDYKSAGEAMSDNLKVRYKQADRNPDGTKSIGYHPLTPQVGIAMAYHQLVDLSRSPGVSRPMVYSMYKRFLDTVRAIPAKDHKCVFITLPLQVQKAIYDPAVLAAALGPR